MSTFKRIVAIATVVLSLTLSVTDRARAADPPEVVVSLAPVQSLVAAVMGGSGEPGLLLPGTVSPHATALRPSQLRMLASAELVFWIGPGLETVLARTLTAPDAPENVALIGSPGLTLLPLRGGGLMSGDDHGHQNRLDPAHTDPHVWLDPVNAGVMVERIVQVLSARYPERAALYRDNAVRVQVRLRMLQADLARRLGPVTDTPYVVFHDAFQYFERRFGLHPVASVVPDPERQPGARRVAEIRDALRQRGVVCIFSEPQFRPALLRALASEGGPRMGELDPLGADLQPGPDSYFGLLDNLTRSIVDCLAP